MESRQDVEERRFLRPKNLATELGVSKATIYRVIAAGGLPAVRIGRLLYVPALVLDELAAAALESGGTVDAADWCKGGAS